MRLSVLSLCVCVCVCVCVSVCVCVVSLLGVGRGYLGHSPAISPAQLLPIHSSTPSTAPEYKPGSTLRSWPDRPASVCCSSCVFLVILCNFWFPHARVLTYSLPLWSHHTCSSPVPACGSLAIPLLCGDYSQDSPHLISSP